MLRVILLQSGLAACWFSANLCPSIKINLARPQLGVSSYISFSFKVRAKAHSKPGQRLIQSQGKAPRAHSKPGQSPEDMLCFAMLCYVLVCYALLCYAKLCYAMPCYATFCYAISGMLRHLQASSSISKHPQAMQRK